MEDKHPMIRDYVLLERQSGGRTMEVFRARRGGRLVSLRLLRDEYGRDPAAVETFVSRGRLALHFGHPNLIRATQVGREDGRHFVATEYAAGQTLAALLERCRRTGQRLSLGHASAVTQAIAEALTEVHAHTSPCRIHPGDVLIGYDGKVRLLVADEPTGFPVYAAPEQIRGQGADGTADLFVLGAMLFEMLTLEPAFRAENEFLSLEKVRRAEVPPPSLWNDRVPNELDDIVRRATARDPGARYLGAAEMVQALVELQKGFMFGAVDLADLLRRLFPEEVKAEAEARRLAEEEAEQAGGKLKEWVSTPRAMHLGAVFWIGLAVLLAGAVWLAAGH